MLGTGKKAAVPVQLTVHLGMTAVKHVNQSIICLWWDGNQHYRQRRQDLMPQPTAAQAVWAGCMMLQGVRVGNREQGSGHVTVPAQGGCVPRQECWLQIWQRQVKARGHPEDSLHF